MEPQSISEAKREFLECQNRILQLEGKIEKIRRKFTLSEGSFHFTIFHKSWKICQGEPELIDEFCGHNYGDKPSDLKEWFSDKLPKNLFKLIDKIEIREEKSERDFEEFGKYFSRIPITSFSIVINGIYSQKYSPTFYCPVTINWHSTEDITEFLNSTFQKILSQ